ncbi:MAG: ATP-binding protein [Elusimicrobiales bacterium]
MKTINTNSSEDKSVIKATPTKELFISMLVRDVTLRDAIGDLLDNCIDGALRLRPDGNYHGLKVEIELNTAKDYFKIHDNCGGMSVDLARRHAFRFGRSDFEAQHTEHSVGVFGIGMKRALFKLGKSFEVKSKEKNSWFDMAVDVNKWQDSEADDLKAWQFVFNKYEEGLKKTFPEADRGTQITVSQLNKDVNESFKTEQDMDELIKELQREHLHSISNGLKIVINKKELKASELALLAYGQIKPAVWEHTAGKVKVRIVVGISEQEKYGPNGGWYVFGNNRLILGPDHTEKTGWGVKTPIRIPEYHPQYYRFRGYVFLEAKDPRELPWNTSKTNMDLDSPVYRAVLQQMTVMMRTVIDFLNGLHDEKSDFDKGRIKSTPLQASIEGSKACKVDTLLNTKKLTSPEKFSHPEPAKPIAPNKPKPIWVKFEISPREHAAIKEYFGKENISAIGREIFDYFVEREIVK